MWLLAALVGGWIGVSLLAGWLASRWFRFVQSKVDNLEDVVIQIQRERGAR